ncbi:hypothetical protein LCGC14_1128120 [marine sediment metagenome]|uniref:Uncharacterized protein n=1 Tax=marine sediment metagenome TaxID=412755 RepID=A0A0F9Q7R2_9ZZZZ
MNTNKILGDAREKMCDIICGNCPTLDACTKEEHTICTDFPKMMADVFALSGITDIKCPECGGDGIKPVDTPFSGSLPSIDCPKCDNGVIKHPWKVSVTLENGELPEDIKNYDQDIADIIIGAGYRQVVELP